ncbi:MAG: 3-hydroxyacyl-CoA dehydrogenase NAD-binding domain-containing protein [Cyclobacteriaceae bacterium]|nr:MAG: 3-hydroxyacyl-CoA dehydrogenase NAD-binding domain-containing protein [Cyclobacteriaceae bacterium]
MTKKIQTVGIAGAGTMGQGIAQVCATAGYEVVLYDIAEAQLAHAKNLIQKSLQVAVEKGKLKADESNQVLTRIQFQSDVNQLKADLIIEAALEKLEIKKELFTKLETINSESCILTTNTSSIPVTQIASALKHPQRFAGLHFFNPAPIMKLVEIISGVNTNAETVDTLKTFCEKLGKTAVLAKDSPGFIVNRVARHYYVEALKLLEENVTDIQTIDALLKASGFKMGPFELMDLIGVDTNFSVTTSIYNAFHQEGKFRPSLIQQQKVDAGHHGRKSGKGFYDYTKK